MWVSGEEQLRRRDEPVRRPWGRRAGAARGSATEQRTGSRAGARGWDRNRALRVFRLLLCERRSQSQ